MKYFFTYKQNKRMKHYMLKANEGELRIMGVNPEDEAAFHATYSKEIIFSGESIQELLIAWYQLSSE
jgi:N-acetyl-anhydromuramyl-L-alanine amidase AmpD